MEADPPRLYNFPTSFYSQKVILALVEKGIPYRSHTVNLGQLENCSPSFLKINPKGQVPVLEDNEKYITGSGEIIKYLDDVYEGALLMPNVGKEKWSHFQSLLESVRIEVLTYGAMVYPHLVQDSKVPHHIQEKMKDALLSGKKTKQLKELQETAEDDLKPVYDQKISESRQYEHLMQGEGAEGAIKAELEKVREILREANDELKDKRGELWLCGPDFTVADISLSILLQRLKLVGYAADLWEDGFLPHIEAYYIRLLMRKTFRTVCVGDASYLYMMRTAFGDQGTIAFILASLTALLIAVWLGFYLADKL